MNNKMLKRKARKSKKGKNKAGKQKENGWIKFKAKEEQLKKVKGEERMKWRKGTLNTRRMEDGWGRDKKKKKKKSEEFTQRKKKNKNQKKLF